MNGQYITYIHVFGHDGYEFGSGQGPWSPLDSALRDLAIIGLLAFILFTGIY